MNSLDSVTAYTCLPHIHIVGSGECVVEGLYGINEYSAECMELNMGKFTLRLTGFGLHIDAFSHDGAIIQGSISTLELNGIG